MALGFAQGKSGQAQAASDQQRGNDMAARKRTGKTPPEALPGATAQQPPPAAAKPVAAPSLPQPPLVEDLMAPEFYASDAHSFSLVQGMITITFVSSRYDYAETPSVLKKVVTSRVVIPAAGAQSMAVRLFAFLNKNGLGAIPADPKRIQ
jgi:hypothetical protein